MAHSANWSSQISTYFSDDRKPFAITLAGKQLYILTSPDDISAAYKETEALTFDIFVRDMMDSFGASKQSMDGMWLPAGDHGFNALAPNPERKSLANLTRDFHKQQLHQGPELDNISGKFIACIDESLQWKHISTRYAGLEDGVTRTVSLKDWCGEVLLYAATESFFGSALLRLKPDLFSKFFDFDDDSWMLMYKYPRFLSRRMHDAKDEAIDALTRYFALPKEQRLGEAWFVSTLETELRRLNVGNRDIATLILQVYWVINSNTWKLCFWMFAYLLRDQALLESIREETLPALKSSGIDMPCLLDCCPKLNAMFDEVLRLTNSSSSVRTVARDITIGGKRLRQGTTVLMPYRQLHFNPDVYGQNVHDFQADRFLQNKRLGRSRSYRPFGGGTTYCPGRFIARQEVVAFVTCVLGRFEITTGKPGCNLAAAEFPELEERKPCLGIMGPVSGNDIHVQVKQRQDSMAI